MELLCHAISIATLALLPAWILVAETPKTATKKTSPPVKPASTTATKKSGARGTGKVASAAKKGTGATASRTATTSTAKRAASARGRTAITPRRPSYQRQMQPTPERYKEIQQALVTRGYLKSDPSGAWDQESMDAMRRFQEDQNINASGKIDSLSLIALGLGPKHDTSARAPAAPESKPEIAPPAAN
jgi:Putative peptidoglycan binding domain